MRRSVKKKSKWKTAVEITAALLLCAIIGAAFVFAASSLAVIRGKTAYKPEKADVIIIPGAKTGSLSLYYRCDRALELYEQGFAQHIIATGAKGDDEWRTEARDAVEYLVERGVPREAIALDEHSCTTEQNLQNARDIMQARKWDSAIIATSDFHVYRCMQLARKLGIDASGAPSRVYEPFAKDYTMREVWIVMAYAVSMKL